MMDIKIHNINPVKPVVETKPAELNPKSHPGVGFEELLRRAAEQDHQMAVREEKLAREKQNETAGKTNENAVHNSATMTASYYMMEQLLRAQNREPKPQSPAPEEEYTR